jgi:hypothetical protein
MAAAGFCSQCGEAIRVKRPRALLFLLFCPNCSIRFKRIRLMLIAIPMVCVVIGFALGRQTSVHAPFYFIGAPVDLTRNLVLPDARNNLDLSSRGSAGEAPPEQLVTSPSIAGTICGARTKSGKPCKRKVKGGGYCWQHRSAPSSAPGNSAARR